MSQVGHRLALGHARITKTRDVSQTGPTVNKAHVAAYESTVTPKRAAQENTKKRTHYTQSVREERGRRKYAAMLARILYNTYIHTENHAMLSGFGRVHLTKGENGTERERGRI